MVDMLQLANQKIEAAHAEHDATHHKLEDLKIRYDKVAAELQKLNQGGGFLGLF
jgi:hypothetical protein